MKSSREVAPRSSRATAGVFRRVSPLMAAIALTAVAMVTLAPFAAPAQAKTTTITWCTWLSGDFLAELKGYATSFERDNPDVKVKVMVLSGDYPSTLYTLFAAGKAPDVMHTWFNLSDDLLRRGMLMDVTRYFTASKFDYSKYLPFSNAYRREGKIWGGLETHSQVYPVFVNRQMFDQAGVLTPGEQVARGGWTWDDYLETAKKLTTDTNGDGKPDKWGTWTYRDWQIGYLPMLLSNGTNYYDAKTNRLIIDNPKAVECFRFMADLQSKYRVAPIEATTMGSDLFDKAKCAMYIDGTWMIRDRLPKKLSFRWEIALPPRGVNRDSGIAPGANALVTASTKHPEESIRFVKYLLGEKAQGIPAKTKLVIPMLKSVIAKDYVTPPPVGMGIVPGMVEVATVQPAFPGFMEVTAVIDRYLYRMLTGKMSVQDALKTSATEGNKILARYDARKKK